MSQQAGGHLSDSGEPRPAAATKLVFSVQSWLESLGDTPCKRGLVLLHQWEPGLWLCPGPPTLRAVLNFIAQAAPTEAHEGQARGSEEDGAPQGTTTAWALRLQLSDWVRSRGRGYKRGVDVQGRGALLPGGPSPHRESIFRKWQLQFRGPLGPKQVPESTRRPLRTALR